MNTAIIITIIIVSFIFKIILIIMTINIKIMKCNIYTVNSSLSMTNFIAIFIFDNIIGIINVFVN